MVEREGSEKSARQLGLVMEIAGRYAIVLTPEGEFRRVRLDRSDRQVGEEMPLVADVSRIRSWPYLPHSVALVTAAAALLLAMVIPNTFNRPEQGPGSVQPPSGPAVTVEFAPAAILAYVSVDVNPSVELGVGTGGLVLSVVALNADATGIVAELVYRGRSVDDVIADITRLALAQGFIAAEKENAVVIAAVSAEEGVSLPAEVTGRLASARQKAREVLRSGRVAGEVEAVSVDRAVLKEEAQAFGMSVGRYLIYLEANKEGLAVDPADLRTGAIGRVLHEQGVRPGEVIRRAASADEDELLDWAKEVRRQRRDRSGDGKPTDLRDGPPRPGDEFRPLQRGIIPPERKDWLDGVDGEEKWRKSDDKERERADRDRDDRDRHPEDSEDNGTGPDDAEPDGRKDGGLKGEDGKKGGDGKKDDEKKDDEKKDDGKRDDGKEEDRDDKEEDD